MVSEYVSNYWKVFYIPKAHKIVNNGIFLEQMKREKNRCDLGGVEFVISDCPSFLIHGYAIPSTPRNPPDGSVQRSEPYPKVFQTNEGRPPQAPRRLHLPRSRL